MERPITRRLLASAIEYTARHKLDTIERERFFVNHYHDEMMEAARVKCVRLLNSCAVNEPVPAEIITELDAIAQALRQAP